MQIYARQKDEYFKRFANLINPFFLPTELTSAIFGVKLKLHNNRFFFETPHFLFNI